MHDFDAQPLPRSALLFMATVEEARRTNEGPFRAVAPLFRIALEPQRGELFNLTRAAAQLTPIFGENFREHAVEAFIPHLVALEWLVPEDAGSGREIYRVPVTLPIFNESEARETSISKLDRLHSAFEEFITLTAPLLRLSINSSQFKWQLFLWATSLDGTDKDSIKAEADKIVGGKRPLIKNAFLDEPQRFSKIDRTLSIELAGFVKWLVRHNRKELQDIASLTELGLAVEFLQELRSPTRPASTTIDTAFVLDAPVLLDLLGLSGAARKLSVERCIDVIRSHGGKIVTLEHCLQELADILKAVLDRPEARRFGLRDRLETGLP